ncbi:MAG: MBL fold metallo-hydrolase, partial [Verrucomicrobiota bacterium]|nr:MBL fold metallo-hydrolase [Verrucomicrobiota bacterium]
LMAPPYFPVPYDRIAKSITIETLDAMEFSIGKIAVSAHRLNHPGTALGYKLTTEAGAIAYLADNEVPRDNVAIRDDLVGFIRNANVVIIDSQYDAPEYGERCGWGHGCVDEVVELAAAANVGRLYLFHHDPEHDDARVDQLVERARQLGVRANSRMQIEGAREGGTFVL